MIVIIQLSGLIYRAKWHVLRLLLATATLMLAGTSSGARIYFSESDTSSEIFNPTLDLDVGESSVLYIWVIPESEATINGLGLSIRTTDPAVLTLTNHEIFNPENTNVLQPRWNAVGGGTSTEDLLISNSNAVSIAATTGLNPDALRVSGDPFAVADAEGELAAYLHSQVDFLAQAVGQADLFLQVGQALITIEGDGLADDVQFGAGDATSVSGQLAGATDSVLDARVNVSLGDSLLGDVNLDGEVNGLDVDPFVEVLLNGPNQPEADMNEDEVVNGLDVDPFVAAVVGGRTQQIPEPSTVILAAFGLFGLVACNCRRR
jgi:hypothetical protein